MHRFILTFAAGILAAGAFMASHAQAAPLGAASFIPLAEGISPVEKVALCFYIDGWNGPGLYQCGYRIRRGEGWYGRREERREFRRDERRDDRRGDRRFERRDDRRGY